MTKHDFITQQHTTLYSTTPIFHLRQRQKNSVCVNRALYSNTRHKLSEVSYGRTSQHNRGLSTMSSPVLSHSAPYRVPHRENSRHNGLQSFDAHHRTDSRRTLDRPPGTTTKRDSLWEPAKWQLPCGRQNPRSERPNLNLALPCDPLTPEFMKVHDSSLRNPRSGR